MYVTVTHKGLFFPTTVESIRKPLRKKPYRYLNLQCAFSMHCLMWHKWLKRNLRGFCYVPTETGFVELFKLSTKRIDELYEFIYLLILMRLIIRKYMT